MLNFCESGEVLVMILKKVLMYFNLGAFEKAGVGFNVLLQLILLFFTTGMKGERRRRDGEKETLIIIFSGLAPHSIRNRLK